MQQWEVLARCWRGAGSSQGRKRYPVIAGTKGVGVGGGWGGRGYFTTQLTTR
jgi:hypothetical protein